MKLAAWASAALSCALATQTFAQEGTVRLPLSHYDALRGSSEAGYAFSDLAIDASVDDDSGAEVTMSASVRVFGRGVVRVVLPSPVPIAAANVDGRGTELVPHAGVFAWPCETAGTYRLTWSYHVDAQYFGDIAVLSLPTPPSPGRLRASFSGVADAITVVPVSHMEVTRDEGAHVAATLVAADRVSLSWREQGSDGYTLSRAHYRGSLRGDMVRFTMELGVELSAAHARVPILPVGIALEEVELDRRPAAIAAEESFVVPIAGRGRHRITAAFSVPVVRDEGLPSVDFSIVPTPVSRFTLRLPGERSVHAAPAIVTTSRSRNETVAEFHLPMTTQVAIDWAEALPTEGHEVELRASADIVHTATPDEGIVSMRAFATFAIARGSASRVELDLPNGVSINDVTGEAVLDWHVDDRRLAVFLDREVEDAIELEIAYERPWPTADRARPFDVPLLRARGVSRQRGMVALLAAGQLTLEPRSETNVTRVGDNQLPPSVRDRLNATVVHTFRYLNDPPRLAAIGVSRPPEPARFDAQVDTLVTLGESTTHLAVLVDLDIKSGALDATSLALPSGWNLLDVSAPSLRRYVRTDDHRVRIELTQPMSGHVRIELSAERVGERSQLALPFVSVRGAEAERGRVAIEARGAFQVDIASSHGLVPVDPSELPEALLLRTDNPILHAFRYARPTPRLSVRVTRHATMETPQASIEQAEYRTLYTRDGVVVTSARFTVRNHRRQFLRVRLPEGARVWSASVDGRSQTPAREGSSEEPTLLIHLASATQAFEVTLLYATQASRIGSFGRLRAELPQLDLVVARTRWELVAPTGVTYQDPQTSGMSATGPVPVSSWTLPAEARVQVPAHAVRFVLTQLYSEDGTASVSIPYANGTTSAIAGILSALGAFALWLGLLAYAIVRLRLPLPPSLGARLPIVLSTYRDSALAWSQKRMDATLLLVSAVGISILVLVHGYLAAGAWPAIAVTVLTAAGVLGATIDHRRRSSPEKVD